MSDFFSGLKTLFLIMVFGNTITLTPSPVDMGASSRLVFNLEKPAKVVTGGAYLSVDVTSMRPAHIDSREDTRKWADEVFGERSISATLINTSSGDTAKVYQRGGIAITSTGLRLFLRKNGGLERGKTYDRIIVETEVELHGVTMHWTNSMM